MKKVIISVTNDLSTDRRVDRTCTTLVKLGFEVLLVGRKRRKSLPLEAREYDTKRMFLFFEKGFLFYAEYNFRLFLFLLLRKCNLLVANDLDTLLPNYLIKKIKKNNLVYDSHEYFTGVPELEKRKFVRTFWKKIEHWIFPKLTDIITVNDSIANLYKTEYGKELSVVRNIPALQKHKETRSKKELGIDESKFIILLQGAGINIDRGAEEAVLAMQFVENAIMYIVGDGDVIDILKEITVKKNLEQKIKFIPKQPMEKLFQYTAHADIGLTLDKDTNINYRFSLPNKLFDYIHAGVPVLASPLVEVEKIIHKYNIGYIIENHNPEHIAEKLNNLIVDKVNLKILKENCIIASQSLNWTNEENKLIDVFKKYI
ncbi:MAG: glycosyltransferase family 4 protein [Bacteroidetes bacterium]|nr:glycosyltransferase family 4 protein [Bacteroidota bacterium]